MNSLSHYNLVHKFIPTSEAMKIESKGKTGESTGMAADERGDRGSKE